MTPIPSGLFEVYALSLPRGLGFGDDPPVNAWESSDRITVCALTQNCHSGKHGILIMRRREDDVWTVLRRETNSFCEENALAIISEACNEFAGRVPLPPGSRRRTPLWDTKGVQPSGIFKMLGHPSRTPGAWMLNQLYLAMPNPDSHWAKECQGESFHTRIWEAMLLASFREQGMLVTQDHDSPDFYVANRAGGEAWVEAVTVNPSERYDHATAGRGNVPVDLKERVSGIAAERYARTLRNKLRKNYTSLKHVQGKPFAIAIADFHAPGSMMWSREALMTYLYGFYGREKEEDGKIVAVPETIEFLLSDPNIRAGLFFSPENIELSAVIFSNAATLSKLSRVPVSSGVLIDGYRYVRIGKFADDSPGAVRAIPFIMDVTSDEYRSLWKPYNHEPWTAEIEIFHNPNAKFPLSSALFPEATHWFPENGEIICKRYYKHSILSSQTKIQPSHMPLPSVESLLTNEINDADDKMN